MQIEKIETFFVIRFLVVRITADDGAQGIGESCYWGQPRAAEVTIRALADALVGMDPSDTEHIYHYLWRYNGSFRGNSLGGAISAIDMALWDIKGKRLQTPVWDLLGGKARQKVRAIALGVSGDMPDECAAAAKQAKDRGYTALKFTPMPRHWPELPYPTLIGTAVAMVEAVRETVGQNFDIGLEIHRNMQPSEAIAFCEGVAKYRPYFVEDPIVPDSVVAMAEVAKKMRLPLAVGERNAGVWEFREFCQLASPAFIKPDIAVAGRITGCKKIAAMAESFHVRVAPHNFQGPIATAACVALGISSPAWDVQDASREEGQPPRRDMVDEPIPVVDGYFIPSDRPGLGVSFDEEAAQKHPFEQPQIPPPMHTDGGVALR